ncbi:RtcB family protein [Nonomuraea thailandensis]
MPQPGGGPRRGLPAPQGAAPGDGRDVLIAGTRGTPSYLVAGHAGPEAGHSVAHGAGRKMSRADALRRGRPSTRSRSCAAPRSDRWWCAGTGSCSSRRRRRRTSASSR